MSQSRENNREYATMQLRGGFIGIEERNTTLFVDGSALIDGDVNIVGELYKGGVKVALSTTSINLDSGYYEDGYVLTTDDVGAGNWRKDFWQTNDIERSVTDPTDNIVYTENNVGLFTTNPNEKLHLSTTTVGEGAQIGNMKLGISLTSNNYAEIVHDDLKAEATSYALQMKNTGETNLNAKTTLNLKIQDVTAISIDNNGDTVINGDLTVNGSTTTIESTVVEVEDANLLLAKSNTSDTLDIGLFGQYNDGTTKYTGMFRDASETDAPYTFFTGSETKPTSTVNTIATGYGLADIKAKNLITTGITFGTDNSIEHDGLVFSSTQPEIFLQTGGNVGLGVTVPLEQLDVSVNANIRGTLAVGKTSAAYQLDVNGDINTSGVLRIDGVEVLDNTTLGSGVVNSSLTSVGTIISLDTTEINTATGYDIALTEVLNATTLGSGVVNSSLENVGTLTSLEITGDLLVDTNTLYVDSTNNNVSIGTTDTTTHNLNVSGDANVGTDYNITGTSVLNSTTLGTGIVDSSLENVGTLTTLDITGDLTVDTNTLYVDSTNNRVGINQSNPSVALDIVGDINISGNMTVEGTSTTFNTETVTIEDPIIHLSSGNTGDVVDTGMYSTYNDGTTRFTGVFRDATDGNWKIFDGITSQPTVTIDTSDSTYNKGTLVVGTLNTDIIDYDTTLELQTSGTSTMTLSSGGNVGVGETTPLYPLHVAKSNVGWSTKIENVSEIFIGNDSGNAMSINSGITSGESSSYILNVRNAETNNLFVVTNDEKVGINTLTPSKKMEVATTTAGDGIQGGIAFIGNWSDDATQMTVSHSSLSGTSYSVKQNSSGETSINSATGQKLKMNINDVEAITIDSSGNIGIGITTPTTNLDVSGNTQMDSLNVIDNVDINGTLDVNDTFYVGISNKVGINTITPALSLHITGTDGIVIPVGTNAERVGVTGAIRYNTDSSTFEGYSGTWGSLGGIVDVDGDTYITAEDSPGANNDQLKFVTGGTQQLIIESTGNVGIGTTEMDTTTYKLNVIGNTNVDGNLSVSGNLTVSGSIIDGIVVEDPLIKLASGNASDLIDIGFYGQYNDGVTKYTGLFRDATDSEYHLFTDLTTEPTDTVVGATTLANLNVSDLTATNLTGTLSTVAQPNITSVGTLTSLETSGAFLKLNTDNTGNAEYSGLYTTYNDGTQKYAGMSRHKTAGYFTFFMDNTIAPTASTFTPINYAPLLTGTLYPVGDIILTGSNRAINIGGQNVLDEDTLGSTITSSFLQSVGTLNSLNMGGDIDVGSNQIDFDGGIGFGRLEGNVSGTGAIGFTSGNGIAALQIAIDGTLTLGADIAMGTNDITGTGDITATNFNGTLATAAQPNITSLGILTDEIRFLQDGEISWMNAIGTARHSYLTGSDDLEYLLDDGTRIFLFDDFISEIKCTALFLTATTTLAQGKLTVSDDLAVDSDTLFVDVSTARVGINSGTAPDEKLHITDTSAAAITYPLKLDNNDSTAGTGVGIKFNVVGGDTQTGGIVNERKAGSDYSMNFSIFDGGLVETMVLRSSSVGIGTNNPSVALDVVGSIQYTGTIADVSDMRVKENIIEIDYQSAYDNVKNISIKNYDWNDDFMTETKQTEKNKTSFIAQEIEAIIPEAIHTSNQYGYEDFKTVNFQRIAFEYFGAFKELQAKYDDVLERLTALENN